MTVAKIEITDKGLFEKIKVRIQPMYCVECGLCGAIKVGAKALARVLVGSVDNSENTDEVLTDFASEFLSEITEPSLEYFKSNEEWQKWKLSNENRIYHFLDPENYGNEMCGKYDNVVVFHNPSCQCFARDKIEDSNSHLLRLPRSGQS